jgi:hypothetical protein
MEVCPKVSQGRSVVTHFDPEKINRHHEAALIGLNGDRYQPFEE